MRVNIEEKKIGDKLTPSEFNEVVRAVNDGMNCEIFDNVNEYLSLTRYDSKTMYLVIEDGLITHKFLGEHLFSDGAGGGASTLGELDNVDKTADDAPDNAVLVSENKKCDCNLLNNRFLKKKSITMGNDVETSELL